MNRDLDIQVTEADIERGVPCDSSRCPIALAVQRAFPGKNVGVTPGYVRLYNGSWYEEKNFRARSDALASFVRKFDNGQRVAPTTILLTEETF